MTDHEDKTVSSFILKEKRHRYRHILTTPKNRAAGLDRLNHCADLDPKHVEWLPSNADIVGMLMVAIIDFVRVVGHVVLVWAAVGVVPLETYYVVFRYGDVVARVCPDVERLLKRPTFLLPQRSS